MCVIVCASVLLLPSASKQAIAKEPAIETPTAKEFEERMPAGHSLTGRELYDRLLKNRRRLRTVYEEGRILSTDPAGNPQQTNFWLRSKDYRDENDDPTNGIYAKLLFKVTGPHDLRHTAYLYIQKENPPDDQFMYSPNRMRTYRVILKGQTLAGTDFSFDDFLTSLDDIEDADYKRHPDTVAQGVPCYVVEAFLKPSSITEYGRSLSYLEKEHYVPLRTRYWDKVGVETKKLVAERASIKEFDGAWLPTRATMTDLLEKTRSVVNIDVLDPNPPLDELEFSVSALASHP